MVIVRPNPVVVAVTVLVVVGSHAPPFVRLAAERKTTLPLTTRKVHPNVQESDRKGMFPLTEQEFVVVVVAHEHG